MPLRRLPLLGVPVCLLLTGALGASTPAAPAARGGAAGSVVASPPGASVSAPFEVAALHSRVALRRPARPATARRRSLVRRHVAHPRPVVRAVPWRPRPVAARPPAPVSVPVSVPVSASGTAWAVLGMLNNERAANGLPALRMNSALISSAHRHNLAMASANTMSHQLPGEASLGNRISAAGYSWSMAGENIGWNSDRSTAGAEQLESVMYAERPPQDGHRLNILNRSFRDIGIDVLVDPGTGKLWLTEDFGAP